MPLIKVIQLKVYTRLIASVVYRAKVVAIVAVSTEVEGPTQDFFNINYISHAY